MVSAMVCHGCGMVVPWFATAFAMDLLWFCYDFAMVLVWVCQGVCHGFALPLLWFAMVFAMALLRKVRGAWLNGTSLESSLQSQRMDVAVFRMAVC